MVVEEKEASETLYFEDPIEEHLQNVIRTDVLKGGV